MTTAKLLNSTVKNQVYLERLKSSEANQFTAFLKRIDLDLRERLTADDLTDFSRTRLEKLLRSVESSLNSIFDEYYEDLAGHLVEIGQYESEFEGENLANEISSELFEAVIPAPEQVRSAVFNNPLSVRGADGGKLLKPFIKDWMASDVKMLSGKIRQGFFEGQTNFEILRNIRGTKANNYKDGALAVVDRHAKTIVRTAVQHSASTARMQTWIKNGISQYTWLSTLDGRTSTICRSLDQEVYDIGKGPVPPIHLNCLPGDSNVFSRTGISGTSKRWFEGELIVINTASGLELSCTPNHPVLTSKGWVAARLLNETCRVICDGFSDPIIGGIWDDQNSPSKIENVVESFMRKRHVTTMPVPVTAPDFHGDGSGSEIAIVGAYSSLKGSFNTSIRKHLCKINLGLNGVSKSFLSSLGHLASSRKRRNKPSFCLIGSHCKLLPLLSSGVSHSSKLLFRPVSSLNRVFFKDPINDIVRNVKSISDSSNPNTRIKQLCDFVKRKADWGVASIDPVLFENSVDGGYVEAKIASDIINGNSGPVFQDDVVNVSRRSFSGHVYNLETGDHTYVANGIITHNCRSTTMAKLPSKYNYLDEGATRASKEGPVDAKLGYYEWLKLQDRGFQDDVLGKTKGQLFRSGGLTVERFKQLQLDKNFKPLTLDEMRKKEKAAFEKIDK